MFDDPMKQNGWASSSICSEQKQRGRRRGGKRWHSHKHPPPLSLGRLPRVRGFLLKHNASTRSREAGGSAAGRDTFMTIDAPPVSRRLQPRKTTEKTEPFPRLRARPVDNLTRVSITCYQTEIVGYLNLRPKRSLSPCLERVIRDLVKTQLTTTRCSV